jgi:CHAT domain-containing protein/Tfp pilus assembly protein PilF
MVHDHVHRILSLLCCLMLLALPTTASASPSRQATEVTLTIENQSNDTICSVLLSSTSNSEWGENWLNEETIVPGETYKFSVIRGDYDVLLTNCDDNTLLAKRQLAINHDQELLLTQADISGAACDIHYQQGIQAYRRGRSAEALAALQVALGCYQEVGDLASEGTTLNNMAAVYSAQGRYGKALESYEQALAIVREVGDRGMEGIVLDNIGLVYSYQGRYREALESSHQALTILREMNMRFDEAKTLNNIGLTQSDRGHYTEALVYYQQALVIMREIGDRSAEGVILDNIAVVYGELGEYARAIEHSQWALTIMRAVGDRAGEGKAIGNIAAIYFNQGRYEEALNAYNQALKIVRDVEDRSSEGTILDAIAVIYRHQGRYAKALESYQQALALWRAVGDRASEAGTLDNMAVMYGTQGLWEEALKNHQQALSIARELGDMASEGKILSNIAALYQNQGRYAEALQMANLALVIRRDIGDRAGEGRTLGHLGTILERQEKYGEALATYKQAIEIIDSLRVTAGNAPARASFIAQYSSLFDRIIALHIKQGQVDDAFVVSEGGRARAFLDSLSTGQVELFDNAATELLVRENEAYAVHQSTQDALAKAKALNPPDPQFVAHLEQQLAAAEIAHTQALTAIQARNKRLTDLVPGRNKNVLSLAQVQAQLDGQTTLISYWMLDTTTWAFVVTADDFAVVGLPEATTEVLRNILDSLNAWSNRENPHPRTLRKLYRWLITPLVEHIRTDHVAIIPHQLLHYVPFAALTDGEHYFGEQHTLAILPSASALPFLAQNAQRANALDKAVVFGNPATGDPDLPSLVYAASEAQAIADLLGTTVYTATAASEVQLRTTVPGVGIVHLAAHGGYNAANPLYSLIALAPGGEEDGRLETHEIFGLRLQGNNLVILSACQTNVGTLSRGDEVVGLTRAFFFAGAPTVISSLWSVDDAATEALMVSFYKHWLQDGMSKAQALQAAQADVRADPRWVSPFFWAGFVLNGHPGQNN